MDKITLTDAFIKRLKTPEKVTEIPDAVVSGMALRVTPGGAKSFTYRYRFGAKVRRYTIGAYGKVSLAGARRMARDLYIKVRQGTDPMAERKAKVNKPEPQTFGELAEVFIAKHIPALSAKSQYEYTRVINKELLPVFGKYGIEKITKQQVYNFLDDKARDHKRMANRIRTIMGKMYSFGIDRGIIKNQLNIVLATPVRREGEVRRDRFYREDEIKSLWQAFEYEGEPVRSLFKILLLTGQRKTETSRMRWDHIHEGIWTIPGADAKNNSPHDVPLSPLALRIIEKMKPLTGDKKFVFTSPVLDNQPVQWLKRRVENVQKISGVNDFRIHDMRRTVATYLAKDRTDRTIIGKILNHKGLAKDNSITAIYDRYSYEDEKRQALERWSQRLQQIIEGETEANIYRIRS